MYYKVFFTAIEVLQYFLRARGYKLCDDSVCAELFCFPVGESQF